MTRPHAGPAPHTVCADRRLPANRAGTCLAEAADWMSVKVKGFRRRSRSDAHNSQSLLEDDNPDVVWAVSAIVCLVMASALLALAVLW